MTTRPSLNPPVPANPQVSKRRAHMSKIRESLQKVPLLHQNVSLARKKISEFSVTSSRDSLSPESEDQKAGVQNFEFFDEKYEL